MPPAEPPPPETLAPARPAAGSGSLYRAGLVVAVAMGLANVCNYAYTVVLSRWLGPADFGALGAMLALILIGTVPGLALQAVAARHTALRERAGDPLAELWSPLLRLILLGGALLGLLALAATPALTAFLHLGSPVPALWLAANLAPVPALYGFVGMLQGRERFLALGSVLLLAAAGKLAGGLALAPGFGVSGALAGAALGTAAAALAGAACARGGLERARWGAALRTGRALGGELGGATLALLGMTLLTNLDVVLARHYLTAEGSGLYAAGNVLTKIAYWGPQFVATVVFSRLVTAGEERRRLLRLAAGVVAGSGALLVLGALLLAQVAVRFTLGTAYTAVGPALPAFAALGTVLALAQLLLLGGIAVGSRRMHGLVAATAVVEATLVALAFHGSVSEIVLTALAVNAALLAAGWALEARTDPAPGR